MNRYVQQTTKLDFLNQSPPEIAVSLENDAQQTHANCVHVILQRLFNELSELKEKINQLYEEAMENDLRMRIMQARLVSHTFHSFLCDYYQHDSFSCKRRPMKSVDFT